MKLFLIRKPHLTERSLLRANQDNIYTFLVDPTATKHQIKEAVTQLYGVAVKRVRTLSAQPESKRTGRRRLVTQTARRKKALVTLKPDNTIPEFEVGGEK